MNLIELHCSGFRCLEDVRFRPVPGINIIRGYNAEGKTSLLEALLFLATSKSHRTNQENELVRHGAQEFHVTGRVRRKEREVGVEAHWWRGAKRFRVNGVSQSRVSDILGQIHVVFFSPEDIGIVRDSAAVRRRFLDMELSQLSPAYLRALQQYRQILRQRNELLRTEPPDEAMLDVWDVQLAQQGCVLLTERRRFLDELAGPAAEAYARIAQEERLEVRFEPDVADDTSLADALLSARSSDLRQRMTTRGPHRDDISILVDGEPARHYGSQGQQRTAALALKLAEMGLFASRIGECPVLMLDDVLSELDTKRSRRLFATIPPEAQCLLTTTDLANKDALLGTDCAYYLMRDGHITRQ